MDRRQAIKLPVAALVLGAGHSWAQPRRVLADEGLPKRPQHRQRSLPSFRLYLCLSFPVRPHSGSCSPPSSSPSSSPVCTPRRAFPGILFPARSLHSLPCSISLVSAEYAKLAPKLVDALLESLDLEEQGAGEFQVPPSQGD